MLAALKKKMDVVIHEDPGINRTFSLDNILSESFEKARLVLIVIVTV